MNARQKAKMYKKKCQQMEQALMATRKQPFVMDRHPVVTLRAEQLVDTSQLYALSATEVSGFSTINNIMASQLFHQILTYSDIETISNPYGYSDKTLIRATMKVIDSRDTKYKQHK